SPGTYRKQLSLILVRSGTPTVPSASTSALLTAPDLVLAADTTETLHVENRRVTGTVVDMNGGPVPGATVSVPSGFQLTGPALRVSTGGTVFNAATTTDAVGAFSLVLFPGSGRLQAVPPPGDTVARTTVDLVVTGDTDVQIVLPAALHYRGTVEDR